MTTPRVLLDDSWSPCDARAVMNEQVALEPQQPSVKRTLVKNTLYVTLTQVLTMPLSILSGWLMARYLTAEDFGHSGQCRREPEKSPRSMRLPSGGLFNPRIDARSE